MSAFLDTSVLLAGLVDFGPQSLAAQSILHAVAERLIARPATAWHCCLEFYSVSTRLPPEFRLSSGDAERLLTEEIFTRFDIHDLPVADRAALLQAATQDGVTGGRIYDAHIAAIARATGASVIVTDNRRHFVSALRHGIRVHTAAEYAAAVRSKKP